MAEGYAWAVQFLLYKSDTSKPQCSKRVRARVDLEESAVTELAGVLEAVYQTRDLVNEP